MRKPIQLFSALIVAVFFAQTLRAQEKPTLNVGDPAPALQQGEYVKGEPVKSFEKGKTYVVEFWATWCGPCRQSIPHLSQMQKDNPDIIFIGQDCWENDVTQVKGFVKEMGDKMDYRVALDDVAAGQRNGKMADTWMKAAGENGIPTAFLVDGDAKIVWIGHPMGLEPNLKKYKEGKLDIEKEKRAREHAAAMDSELSAAMKSKDYKQAIAVVDKFAKDNPESAKDYAGFRYSLLIQAREFSQALAAAPELAKLGHDDAMAMNELAWSMVDPAHPFENPDLELALQCAKRAHELAPDDANITDTLAHVHAARGEWDKAIELESQAVAKSEGPAKSQFEKAVAEFKSKKSAAAK